MHACIEQKALLDLYWVSAEMIEEKSAEEYLNDVDAIVAVSYTHLTLPTTPYV